MNTNSKRPPAPTFKDLNNRVWPLTICLGHIPKLRELGILLGGATSPDVLGYAVDRIGSDPEVLASALWIILESKATRERITQQDFFDALDGPALHAAQEAIILAIAEFGQRPEVAALIRQRIPKAMAELDEEEAARIRALPPVTF